MISIKKDQLLIGIISDTHGLFRPEINDLFNGVDYIIHAGDIGTPDVIDSLSRIAPILAILGNTDSNFLFPNYSETEIFESTYFTIYILHNLDSMDLDPETTGFNIVISGHTHRASIVKNNNILYINPGSAGPQRSNIPVSIALLHCSETNLHPEIIEID